jgi:PKD repeat protein
MEAFFMKHVHIWSVLAVLSASSTFLIGDTWKALVTDPVTQQIFPIDLGPNQSPTAEAPITGIADPFLVFITPDATKAVVTNSANAPAPNFFELNLTTTPISIGPSATIAQGLFCALSPDGSKFYASGRTGENPIYVVQTSDLSVLASVPASDFAPYAPVVVALSPNKPEGYVSTGTTKLFIFDTDTNRVKNSIDTTFGTGFLVVTPDGTELYISHSDSSGLSYVTLSDNSIHDITGLPAASVSRGIAMAPDGSALYAIQLVGTHWYVIVVDTKTHSFVTQHEIPSQLTIPSFISITPDGKTACIPDTGVDTEKGHLVAFMDLATGASTIVDLTSARESQLFWSAITPDQAPTARFTPTVNGATVTFDASASSSPVGSIATYAWDFGDGQTTTTTSPTISHTYTTNGTFTIVLTVTNTSGTSTVVTFTGQMVSNNGGPSAETTQQITVQLTGVASFKGKVHRDHKDKKVSLKTKWTKSLIPNTRKYEIFARNTKIATVKASHKRHQTLRLHPHHFPHKISKDYRHYLDHKYNIRVVDTLGHSSQPTFVHVVKH